MWTFDILRCEKKRSILTVILIIILGLLIYSNTFKAGFQFDDSITIVDNYSIRHFTNLAGIWRSFNARFLVGLSFAINYYFGKLDVSGYHIVNIALHVLCAVCVYFFVILTFETPALKNNLLKDQAFFIGFFSALLFLVHPVQTQGVAYISQRFTSFVALCYLSSLVFYIQSRLTGRASYRIIALVTTILGMFSKETMLTIPATLTAYEFFFFGPWTKDTKKRLRPLVPFFMALLIIPLAVMSDDLSFASLGARREITLMRFDPINFFTEINVLCTYLRLLFLPISQNFDYDYPMSPGLFSLSTFPCVLILIGLLVYGGRQFNRERLISFCILWFFITTSIEAAVCTLLAHHMIFEHYLYLAMVGFAIFVSAGLFLWLKETKRVIMILSLFIVLFSFLTYQRNKVWQTPVALWQDVLKKSPNKPRAYYNLGIAYSQIGDYDRAIDYYHKTVVAAIRGYTGSLHHLGIEYGRWKDAGEAINFFQSPVLSSPEWIEEYVNRGLSYIKEGNYDESMNYYYVGSQPKKHMSQWYAHLAYAHGQKGDYDKEIDYSQKAIELDSENAMAFSNLGRGFLQKGEYEKALAALNQAIELEPYDSQAHSYLGLLYLKQNDYVRADDFFKKALEFNPNNAEALNYLMGRGVSRPIMSPRGKN